jgi:hypothetical protein
MTRDFTSCLGSVDHKPEIAPFNVAQQMLNVPCQPILHSRFGLLCMALKSVSEDLNQFFIHSVFPF